MRERFILPACLLRSLLVFSLILVVSACTANKMYRKDYVPCTYKGPGDCAESALQVYAPGAMDEYRLVVIGHSFGGAVVYTSLQKILADRFIDSRRGKTFQDDAKGFGDLVVLMNPAFEALRFASLYDLSQNGCRRYFSTQVPRLAILTIWATHKNDEPLEFDGSRLVSLGRTTALNPYLNISVDKALINDHNDIWRPRVANFIRELIVISTTP